MRRDLDAAENRCATTSAYHEYDKDYDDGKNFDEEAPVTLNNSLGGSELLVSSLDLSPGVLDVVVDALDDFCLLRDERGEFREYLSEFPYFSFDAVGVVESSSRCFLEKELLLLPLLLLLELEPRVLWWRLRLKRLLRRYRRRCSTRPQPAIRQGRGGRVEVRGGEERSVELYLGGHGRSFARKLVSTLLLLLQSFLSQVGTVLYFFGQIFEPLSQYLRDRRLEPPTLRPLVLLGGCRGRSQCPVDPLAIGRYAFHDDFEMVGILLPHQRILETPHQNLNFLQSL